ncbi:hypothetical protein NC651_020207 [Populus alba x Populus x berolinensis]|nr:hypothetical protein NC651_020207 [Populus alba x Populus x berolinensis]
MILQLLILEGDPKGGFRLTNEIKTTLADHQPIYFPSSRFLILGIFLLKVRDTVAVLNGQKSISCQRTNSTQKHRPTLPCA